ncbi:MAG: DUF411 domain-containing protein, partial [Thiolinea sp.]
SHSKLLSSEPAHQEQLSEAPKQVVLKFNQQVRLMKLVLTNTAQEPLETGFKPSSDKMDTFTVQLPVLAAGTYRVKWLAMSGDSHKIKGEFTFAVLIQKAGGELPVVTVYKSATCGCCKAWVGHLENNGFTVKAHDVGNMLEYKQRAKLGAGMGSCHTAFVDGYAVEGHVPAQDLKRMLLEKPDISGLTVPRMPIGSPGMEVPGRESDAFQVLGYKEGEVVGVFSDYPAGSVFE